MQNLARFYTTSDFDREYLRNDSRYPKSDRYRFLSYVRRNKSGELWSTIQKVWSVSLDPPKSTFWTDYISATRGCWLLKFLHALEFDQALVAHISIGVGGPLKLLGPTFKIGLKIPHMSAYIFGHSGLIVTKLYQGTWLEARVIKWTLILQEVPPTKFGRAKMSKIRRDFWQLSTLITNISGTDRHVENRKSTWSTTFHPLLGEKKFGELWSTNQKVIDAHVDLLKWTFSGILNFGRCRGWWTLKFLHTADISQDLLAHITCRVGDPPKNFKSEHLKLGLKFYTWAPIIWVVVGVTLRNFTRGGGSRPGWTSGH